MFNKKILFISNRLNEANKNGANVVAKRNLENLIEILGNENVFVYSIKNKCKIINIINNLIFNRIESITLIDEKNILKTIAEKNIDYVFLDTSCYGFLARKLNRNQIKIITFCHDITKELYSSLIKNFSNDSLKNLIKKLRLKQLKKLSEMNENITFKHSDILVTLNERETKLLKREYNCSSDIQIPISFPVKKSIHKKEVYKKNKFNILFVGVAGFTPNMQGIQFFIKNVLPELDVELNIVGKNMENYKELLENEKVNIIGTVDALDDYYLCADIVIAPIFLGGGMKVKTAEALMYGKTIFGTTEAFEGYELNYDKVGGLCNTADEFIEKINKYIKNYNGLKENKYSKDIFMEKYSYEASKKLFEKVLKEL